jgi:hypothetical protein
MLFHGDPTAGIRTYFAIERSTTPSATAPVDVAQTDPHSGPPVNERFADWPRPDAFLSVDSLECIGEGARCTALAICDDRGEGTRVFEMGQTAVIFFEYVLDEDIQVPICGIEIFNERNILVHGKNSLQQGTDAPASVPKGARIRVRRSLKLDIAQGNYSIGLGLATAAPADAAAVEEMSYPTLASRIRTMLVIPHAGSFSVSQRKRGQALPFHGLCVLTGDIQLFVSARDTLISAEISKPDVSERVGQQ